MKRLSALTFAALITMSGLNVQAAEATSKTKEKGAKPADSPGWIVIEEDVWTPLRFEPLRSLDSIPLPSQ